jgi:hypothetical protein
MRISIHRQCLAALVFTALVLLGGCAPGQRSSMQVALLPQPLTAVKVAYVSAPLYPDPAQGHARARWANFLNPSGNYIYTHSETDRARQTIALQKHELDKVDGKVLRFAPGLLQQHGLKGEATSFVTSYRFIEVVDAAADSARAQGIGTDYWLVIAPTGAQSGGLITSVEFRAVLSNIVERKVYWQGDYTVPGAPVDDAQVQGMLTAFLQDITRQP